MITQTELIRREKIRYSKIGDKNPMKRKDIKLKVMGDKNVMRRVGMSEKMRKIMLVVMNKPEVRLKVKLTTPVYYGKKSPGWRGGISRFPYSYEFNDILKQKIRERDNYTCQLCILSGSHVHHIDYNKENNHETNLITLCSVCHGKTNGNRFQYQLKFNDIILIKYVEEFV
jgi:hypothetical protein